MFIISPSKTGGYRDEQKRRKKSRFSKKETIAACCYVNNKMLRVRKDYRGDTSLQESNFPVHLFIMYTVYTILRFTLIQYIMYE